MDKSSFQKLFKEMYQINPAQWNNLLTKAGKTVYSAKPKKPNSKVNRQSMGSSAFDKLMHIDYKNFQNFANKSEASVNRPQSIRINNMTLPQMRGTNMRNANANTSYANSSAVEQFSIKDSGNGKKDVTIKYVGGKKDYLYPDVPANVANGLYAAPSKGSYVGNVISRYSDYSNPKVQQKIRQG